jgi:Oxygen-sensitive ribonucleoside-triphosphate reductase
MPCYRCGARQTDPVRGVSPWKRGVRRECQVLICPDCQRSGDLDLDTCATCGSTTLICRLGEVECRSCGAVRLAVRHQAGPHASASPYATAPGLSEEVAAALDRVLGRTSSK